MQELGGLDYNRNLLEINKHLERIAVLNAENAKIATTWKDNSDELIKDRQKRAAGGKKAAENMSARKKHKRAVKAAKARWNKKEQSK